MSVLMSITGARYLDIAFKPLNVTGMYMGSRMGGRNHFQNVKMYPFIFVKLQKRKFNPLKTLF